MSLDLSKAFPLKFLHFHTKKYTKLFVFEGSIMSAASRKGQEVIQRHTLRLICVGLELEVTFRWHSQCNCVMCSHLIGKNKNLF